MVLDIAAALGREQPQKFVPEVVEEDEECKIFVSNIPEKLRNKGLKNFFQKFGKIVDMYYPSGNRWAFVTYSNKAECEAAIMRIQEVFGMKADFAKKKDKIEVEELIEEIPWEPSEPKNDEAEKTVTPFNLPTSDYEFPPFPITEADYEVPEMIKFDPKKEFLLSHDMLWVERMKREAEMREKKTSEEKNVKDTKKVFSLINSKELATYPVKNCANCKKRKALYCRSNDKSMFCSMKCQKMQKETSNTEKSVSFPPNKSLVTVTAIFNPREIFLRSVNPETNADYIRLINEVHNHAQTAAYLSKPPQSHTMALARKGKIFTRAFIVSTDTEMNLSTVILVDFGDIERIPWSEMKQINEELASEPRYIFRCNLKDVNALHYNGVLKGYLKHIDGVQRIIYSDLDEKTIPEITLKVNELGELTMNEQMTKFVERTEKEITMLTYNCPNVDETKVWPEKDVEIIILDNSFLNYGILSVAIYWQYIEFLHQWEVMQNHCESLGDKFVPLEDEMCLVKLIEDDKWHRATCIGGNHHRILNILVIDRGVRGAVSTSNVRKLPIDFNFPQPLKICKIQGLPDEIPNERVEELKLLLPQNKRLIAKELLNMEEEDFYQLTIDV